MLDKINSLFECVAENSQEWKWALVQLLSAAMFMTHGYSNLFSESPQPYRGGGITSINISDLFSWTIPIEINALYYSWRSGILWWPAYINRLMDTPRRSFRHLHYAYRLSNSPCRVVSDAKQRRTGRHVLYCLSSDFYLRPRAL